MKNLSFLAAALLIAALAAPAAQAQEESSSYDGYLIIDSGNSISADLAGVSPKSVKHQETAPDCPGNSLTVTLHYPQGFSADLDRLIEKISRDKLAAEISEIKAGGFCDKDICGGASCGAWASDEIFNAYTPSPGYVSILFMEFSYTGGAHPNTEYRVMNFKPDGQSMELKDLFPDPEKSAPLYWEHVYAQWCAEHSYKFPLHYAAVQDCGTDSPDNPNTYEGAKTLDDLGRLVFTPFGATIVLGPYESGSYATGTVRMDISKEDFIKMGADPAIWGSEK